MPRIPRLALSLLLAAATAAASAQAYKVTNLVSDGSVPANLTDPGFINPWGVSVSSNWWISAAHSGFNYVVSPTGTIPFKVIVPAASGLTTATGLPAGSVTTAGASGMILPNGAKASFLFSTLDGTISGWNSKLGTAGAVAQIVITNPGASYPGLALLNVGATASYLLAPNFAAAAIEVYDSNFKAARLAGAFTDPGLPSGYSPFSIHILNGQVWVAYAVRTATAPYRTVDAPGNGIIDTFDQAGNFVARIVTGGNLNSPWGVAFAPASFGIFSGDLLIGNFGDGLINVYDPKTYKYLGQLFDSTGKSLAYPSLWELLPGGTPVLNSTSVSAGDTSTVYFTAGLTGEAHGLFAAITSATTSGAAPTFGFTASPSAATVTAGTPVQAIVSVAPVNGFSGTVTFTCTGLPVGASCTFSPTTVTASAAAPATTALTINTTMKTASLDRPTHPGIFAASALPFALLLLLRRRARAAARLQVLATLALGLTAAAFIAGCADYGPVVLPYTPAGQSTVTVTATSGATKQQTNIAMTVK